MSEEKKETKKENLEEKIKKYDELVIKLRTEINYLKNVLMKIIN